MHHRASTRGLALLVALAAALVVSEPGWALPGEVVGEHKISDTQGNFTAVIDNLDEFGGALSGMGDLDGAGPSTKALAVGVIGDDDGGGGRGCVYILFLDDQGQVLSYQKISDLAGNFTAPLANADEFGSSVAWLGDLDGAGPSVAALAVGAVGEDDLGGSNRGAVYILFLDATGNVLSYQTISDVAGNFTAPLANGDEMGGALAWLGDLDGAGPSAAALAVGAIGDDDGGTDRGCVYIMFLDTTGNVLSYQTISDTQGNFTAPLVNANELGSSVAWLGDLDGAGASVATLAIGAIGENGHRGSVYITFLDATGNVTSYTKVANGEGGFAAVLDELDELGGSVVGLGDLDPYDAPYGSATVLAVGAVGDDDGGLDRGCVYILFLNSAGTVVWQQKISSLEGGLTGPLEDGDDFTGSLGAIGPVGLPYAHQGLAVGAPGDDDGGGGRGAVYILQVRGVKVSGSPETPPAGRLHVLDPARPNPFNPSTTLAFAIGVPGRVALDIWDIAGRRVRRLEPGALPAGRHQVTWNGLDAAGRRLASGTYVVELTLDGVPVAAPQKAVLLK